MKEIFELMAVLVASCGLAGCFQVEEPFMITKMAAIPPGNQAAAMEMIKKMPGMKIDMNDELRVSFQ